MSKRSEERHNEAFRQIQEAVLHREWLYDKDVVDAVREVVGKTTPSHTVQSKTHSLLQLIKAHFDPALMRWMSSRMCNDEWMFSDLLLMPPGTAHQLTAAFGLQGRVKGTFLPDAFCRMADLLHFFRQFCSEHQSETIKKVYLDAKDRQSVEEAPERIGKGLKSGARSDRKRVQVPSHLLTRRDWLYSVGLCQACGDPTAANCDRESVIDPQSKIDRAIKKKIAAGMDYSSKTRGSQYFCPQHNERDGSSKSYKDGRYQIDLFLSLLLAMRYWGILRHVNTLFPIEFHFSFAKMAIRSPASRKDLLLITECLAIICVDRSSDVEIQAAAKSQILQAIHRIFFDDLKLTALP
jgi:rubrerythrin